MFWSPLSEIHIRQDLLFSSSSKGKKINFFLYHKCNNDYTQFVHSLEARWTLCSMCWRTQCQLIFTGRRHSQADPSFYAITVVWCFARIQQMCTIHMKCWLLILHCQCWWKPGIMFLSGSSVLDKVLNTMRAAENKITSGIHFPDLAIKSLGRFAIDFSMVRISEVRLQISGIAKCICGNQQSQNTFF